MILGTEFFNPEQASQMITFNSKHKGNSQLWQCLHKFYAFVQMQSYLQGTQWQEEFFSWNDTWIGSVPLKIKYPGQHKICEEPNATVAEYWTEDDWDVNFSGSLSSSDYNSWVDLMAAVHYKSVYRLLTDGGVSDSMTKELWK